MDVQAGFKVKENLCCRILVVDKVFTMPVMRQEKTLAWKEFRDVSECGLLTSHKTGLTGTQLGLTADGLPGLLCCDSGSITF